MLLYHRLAVCKLLKISHLINQSGGKSEKSWKVSILQALPRTHKISILHSNHAEPLFKGISKIVYNRLAVPYKLLKLHIYPPILKEVWESWKVMILQALPRTHKMAILHSNHAAPLIKDISMLLYHRLAVCVKIQYCSINGSLKNNKLNSCLSVIKQTKLMHCQSTSYVTQLAIAVCHIFGWWPKE